MPSSCTLTSARPLLFRWLDSLEADERLKRPVRHTALALSREMNMHGQHAFPSHARLAERIGCDEKTVRRHLDVLRDLGWLSWHNFRRDGARLSSNRYTPHIPDGYEIDTRIYADKSQPEMSENYSGETCYETRKSSDILISEYENTCMDIAIVSMRQHFSIPSSAHDGHMRLREALLEVVIRYGLEGLRAVYDIVTKDVASSLATAKSPCRVLAHRVTAAGSTLKLDQPGVSFVELIDVAADA